MRLARTVLLCTPNKVSDHTPGRVVLTEWCYYLGHEMEQDDEAERCEHVCMHGAPFLQEVQRCLSTSQNKLLAVARAADTWRAHGWGRDARDVKFKN
jgi:hypothetical protein